VVVYSATFEVDINLGYLKKTDNFLSQNANLMVSLMEKYVVLSVFCTDLCNN